jgi:DNA-binding transcriptional LysR family regulator
MVSPSDRSNWTELQHLGTFVTAAELGSFTATAAELGLTQAAISQRIAALERQLAVSLFDRHAGRIGLTEAGARLYEFARQIIDLHDQAREAVGGLRVPVSGELLLATSSVPGECFLPRLLAGFHSKFPRVHVRATIGDTHAALRDLESGRAALALVGAKSDDAVLEFRHIGSDGVVLVVPTHHRWVGRRVSPTALRDEPLILREPGSGTRCAVLKRLEQSRIPFCDLTVALELGSNGAIKDAVIRQLGVAFLSQAAVRKEVESGELAIVDLDGVELQRDFYLAFDRRRPLPPPARAFLRHLETNPLADPDS